jgi:hypothetical protein
MQADKLKSLLGGMNGWFIVILSIICAFAIFMSVSNCVAYGTLISKDNPDISKGFCVALLVTNIIVVILVGIGFFWLINFYSKFKTVSQSITIAPPEKVIQKTFNVQGLTTGSYEKALPLIPKNSYSKGELEAVSYQLRPQFAPPKTESLRTNKYD